MRLRLGLALLAGALMVAAPAVADQNDAGTGGDAGNTFATATPIAAGVEHVGSLERAAGDRDDFYTFFLDEGASASIQIRGSTTTTDPMQVLDPDGVVVDAGAFVSGLGASHANGFTSELASVRLAVHRARIAGYYRLRLTAERFDLRAYHFCIMNCETPRMEPTEFIFGGALKRTRTRVLLVPPAHGDLGNPLGPTVKDYLDTTLRAIRTWERALGAFAADYPQYGYLKQIDVEVEVFDTVDPVDPAGYEVIVVYVAAGPVFRGVAVGAGDDPERIARAAGVNTVNYTGRYIALSLFGSSPRAGQVLYDFPELNDLEIVTIHEFGHTFGLGHTQTIDPVLGHDLMNSPAPFVYGDGSPAGAGNERTAMKCLSSLNLWGMAHLYRWVPSGVWRSTGGVGDLPPGIPYTWYC